MQATRTPAHRTAWRTPAAWQRQLLNCSALRKTDVAVASTGVIGQRLNIECIEEHLPELKLEDNASEKANRAIMTTDTKPKTAAVEFTIGGKTCRIGGICKGSGMIHPNMGTMLSFITTDCAITHEMLTDALQENVKKTYNRVTVDGDTSTNDMCIVLANGMAGNDADRVAGRGISGVLQGAERGEHPSGTPDCCRRRRRNQAGYLHR